MGLRNVLLEKFRKVDIPYIITGITSSSLYLIVMSILFPEYYMANLFVSGFIIGFTIATSKI